MTPGKFQAVTEALMAWIFPGDLEISRGPWKFPGGYRNLGGMVFSRGHGHFQGGPGKIQGTSLFHFGHRVR